VITNHEKGFSPFLGWICRKTQVAFRKPPKTMMGKIISINIDAKTVILKAKKCKATFAVDDKAKILMGNQYETPTDLKAGNKRRVS